MNDYFSSVGIKLQQQFRYVDNNLYEFAAPRLLRLFYISYISIQDIVTEISRLNTIKAVGSDNIGAKIVRMCPEIFASCQNTQQSYRKSQISYTTENCEGDSPV